MSKLATILLLPAILLVAVSCAAGEAVSAPAAEEAMITLKPERAPAAGEALWLEVFIGALPAESTLVILNREGREIGGIAPFGKVVRQAGGSHLLPLPADLQSGAPLQLRAELHVKDQKLKPTADELREIKLVYVPVTK